ncbi:MAG: hypothetical protein Q9181_008220, partial [Wetmoreana brouardii]
RLGGGVPASSISLRINKLKKEVREKGLLDNSPTDPPTSTAKRSKLAGTSRKKATKAPVMQASDESDDNTSVKSEGTMSGSEKPKPPVTNYTHADDKASSNVSGKDKVITGRVVKSRKSPRKSSANKKEYAKMLDPYNEMDRLVDEEGNRVFAHQRMTPEDSYPSDAEYDAEKEAPALVNEPAEV